MGASSPRYTAEFKQKAVELYKKSGTTYAEVARDNDVRLSCGRTGSCHDNAVAESFFATLKNEMYHRGSFATRADAKHAVIRFIEVEYSRRRPHSTIGYQIPAQAMEAFFGRTRPAAGELPLAA